MRITADERLNYITKAHAQLFLGLNKFPEKKPKEMTKESWEILRKAKGDIELSMGHIGMAIIRLLELQKKYDK